MPELAMPTGYRLRFAGALERQFQVDYYHNSIAVTRLGLALGMVLVAVFGLLDLLAAPAALAAIWRIRFLVICPALGLVLLASYVPALMRAAQPLIVAAVLAAGLGIAAMSAVVSPAEPAYTSYYAGLILVIVWNFTFIRLRFWYATAACAVIIAGYELVAIFYQRLLAAPMGGVLFISNNFFFVAASIVGMVAGYFIERYIRHDFLRRRALEAALAQSSRLTAILEATTDVVGVADLAGQLVYMNRAGRRIVGAPETGPLSLSFGDVYTPESLQQLLAEGIPQALRTGSWAGEATVRNMRSGALTPVSLVGVVHYAADGAPEFLSAVLRDISERKQAEAALTQAKEAAEGASRTKSAFLANMSHEIRTPMNAVIGMTGLLLNTPLDARQRDFVETIRGAGDTLLTVINDILDFSKIEAEKLTLDRQPFDLRACIESAFDLLAPRAAEQRIELAYLVDEGVPQGLVGDATRLRQVLVNLLSNAIKFTHQGEVVLSVSSGLQEPATQNSTLNTQHSTLRFAVRDTGIGIAADKLGQLFQPFSQIDASLTRGYGGTGLGLAISRRLAELMGGTMWVESAGPGQGSTFHFTIAAPAAEVPARRHLRTPRPELRGKRALIVDDNPTNRRILSLQIESWGMLATEAALPSAALALVRRGDPFDLALLDMHLPEMDGLALAGALRAERPGEALPLVMLTSVGDSEAQADLLAAVLTKPVKPSQLYDVLVGIFAAAPGEPAPAPAPDAGLPTLAAQLPLRILLAEDVAVNRKFALLALEELGYQADVATNGLEALAAVARRPYDVVLMDVQMPELDGLAATRRIHMLWAEGQAAAGRAQPAERSRQSAVNLQPADLQPATLPSARRPYIIAMTANALQGDRELCLAAGMDDYISKPVYLEDLRAALRKAGMCCGTPAQAAAPVEPQVLAGVLARPGGQALIDLFVQESGDLIGQLSAAAERGDAPALRQAAHSLKGSSGYLGARQLVMLAAELERRARAGDLAGAPALIERLTGEFARVRAALGVPAVVA